MLSFHLQHASGLPVIYLLANRHWADIGALLWYVTAQNMAVHTFDF